MHRTTDRLLQRVLQGGLLVGVALLAVGLAVDLATGVRRARAVRLADLTAAGPVAPRLMLVGVIVIGLTPLLGVVVLGVRWARERDWLFVAVAGAIVVVVALGVVVGRG